MVVAFDVPDTISLPDVLQFRYISIQVTVCGQYQPNQCSYGVHVAELLSNVPNATNCIEREAAKNDNVTEFIAITLKLIEHASLLG
jgi:hypothetical protein